jgi:hypothetical protein
VRIGAAQDSDVEHARHLNITDMQRPSRYFGVGVFSVNRPPYDCQVRHRITLRSRLTFQLSDRSFYKNAGYTPFIPLRSTQIGERRDLLIDDAQYSVDYRIIERAISNEFQSIDGYRRSRQTTQR